MPIITGTTGPDVLTGTPFSDEIDGLGGNDLIEGGQDSDTLNGGDGNDYLNHNTRTPYTFDDFSLDTLNGGAGNDVIDIGIFDTADGGDGIDRVTSYQTWRYGSGVNWDLSAVTDIRAWFNGTFGVSTSNFEQYGLAAGDGNDVIIGFDQDVIGGPASTLEGLGGNDRLEGRGGRDELYGGTGNDILRGDDGDDLLDGGEGHDDIQGGAGFDTLGVTTVGTDAGHFTIDLTITGAQDTGAGVDTISGVEFITVRTANASQTYGLYGDGGLNVLTGGLGDDILDGRDGNDVLRGGAGADLIVGGNGADEAGYNGSDAGVTINLLTNVVSGGHAQGDTLISIENLTGSEFADDLTGDMTANRLQGNGGNDVLNGLAGMDVLIGGMGADILDGGDDNDTLWGSDGRETSADNAVDTLNGGGGNDNITLGEGDIGDGGVGGFDQAFVGFYGRTSGIVLDLSGGTEAAVEAAGGFQLSNFEAFHITGTAHDDVITGSAVGEQLNGGEGNDHLIGGGGLDTLLGGLGNDVLDGGVANDQLRGGAGDDVYILDDTGDAVFENLNEGTDEVRTGFATYALGANVENLTFSGTGAHTGVGNALDNVLTGNDGDDVMTGGLGNDQIHGGGGSDTAVFAGPRSAWSISYVPGGVLVSNATESNVLTGVEFLAFADGTVPVATPVEIVGTEDGETLSGDTEAPVIEIIRGLGGSDMLYGFGGDDTLYGGGESDQLSGGDGDDTVYGETGYDTLFGGAGADVLDGGSEGDTLDGAEGDDRLYGGSGDDNLAPGAGVDYVDGGTGEDNIYFVGDAVVINLATGVHGGGAAGETFISVERFGLTEGDDEATGTSATERFIGGGGNDVLRSGGGGGFLFGGEGNDTLIGGEGGGEEYLQGDAGDDTIHGGGGTDYLFADRGDDILDGGDGDDTMDFQSYGGLVTVDLRITGSQYISDVDGSDTLSNIENLVGETFTRVYHFTGDDNLNRLSGGGLDDILNGMGGNDSINGGQGADQLDGGDGNDNLYGGSEDDTALGGVGNDNLYGDSGSDTLDGGDGNDFVYAGADADVVRGGVGADVLYGDGGDDVLSGGAGVDDMIGSDGIDTVAFLLAAGGVVASLATGEATNDGDGATDTFSGVENLTGSAFADVLTGDGGANVLSGAAGNDQLLGGDGDDVLRGGAGVDVLTGGLGNDTADYTTAAAGMRAQLNSNASTNDGDGGTDTFSGIENLTGSAFNDTLIGDGNVNVLRGGTGADTLLGLGGADVLWGGSGALNTLQGGLGDDTYVLEAADSIVENVGEGADTVDARIAVYTLATNTENLVFGGTGNFTGTGNALANTITGGAGDDNLRGRGGIDVLNGGDGVDTVDYTLAAAGVTARLDLNRATNDGDGATDTFTGVENLTGSNFNDLLIGNAGNNILMGGIGTDTLLGFGGDDVLWGGSGGGNNQLQGGQGNDWYVLDAFDTCVELVGEGIDTVEARVGSYTLGGNIENLLYTGPGKFVGSGNALDNHITGWTQNDILRGGGGNDTIDGGGGSDEVQFRGSKAQYTVTVEGEGYRIVDSVVGRDGSTFVTSIEVLRFITGNTTTALSYPPPAPAALESVDKDAGPLTSPIGHDDFLLSTGHDGPEAPPAVQDKVLEAGPQVLPGAMESMAELRELFALHHGPHALYIQPEPDYATTDHRDWM